MVVTRSLAESLAGGSPVDWARDFLTRAGFPITGANLQTVVSWELAESGAGGGMWNPLNTTQGGYAGESDFNSVGVKNYASRDDGLAANARVIHNGFYPAVVARFMFGQDARGTADAITASPWGTGHIVLVDPPPAPPAPAPKPEVLEMHVIALPQKGTPAGRDALAVWDPEHPNRIVLENGARLVGDEPSGIPGVRFWTPKNAAGAGEIPPGVHGIGIAPVHGRLGHVEAVVLACTGANTYRAALP